MTKQEIITLIEGAIVANGTNDITADVLRPVLVSMATQINDAVGSLANLDTTTKDNIVNALNEMFNLPNGGGITILTGTANPNTTAPQVVSLGDFYNRTFSGNTIEFYIFNGIEWVLLSNTQSEDIAGFFTGVLTEYTGSSFSVGNDVTVAIYVGNVINAIANLPDPFNSENREITFINQSNNSIRTSNGYRKLNGTTTVVLDENKSITLKAKSLAWIQIR